MSLLARVARTLELAGIRYALIGAAALSLHGVSRSTLDQDLLTVDPASLDPDRWQELARNGVEVDIRRGDLTDPLAGVARFTLPGERPVDLVVGRGRWQAKVLERARRMRVGDVELPVLSAADLVLVKLYAGGPQDAWDIHQLLAGSEPEPLVTAVEAHLPELPRRCQQLWQRIRAQA